MDFENMKALVDFADERNVKANTIVQYIKSHPEIKEHVYYDTVNKNKAYLDDEAVKMLSEKYRLHTEIITDTQLYDRIVQDNERMHELAQAVLMLQKQLAEKNEQLLQMQQQQLMIEQKEEQHHVTEEKVTTLQEENRLQALELEKLRLERDNMINGSYFNVLREIARLRRKKPEK